MNSKKMISRPKKTIFRRLSFAHYPNRRTRRERHIGQFSKTKMKIASRLTMRMKSFNIDLGPFQNQSRTKLTLSIKIISLPWRTSPILVVSLLKLSSDL